MLPTLYVYLPPNASLSDPGDFGSRRLVPALSSAQGQSDSDARRPLYGDRGFLGAAHLAKLEPRQSREIGFY